MTGREEILHLLAKYHRFILGCHLHPDGDAIGSLLALGLALETAGKDVAMVVPGGVPVIYRFLEGTEKILPAPSLTPEVIIALDCADRERLLLPETVFASGAPVINIDHHLSNSMFGDFNHVFPEAAATGEIVHDLLIGGGFALDKRIAEAIYTAVATDTGFFRFSNTSGRVFALAAGLVATYGISPSRIAEEVYEERSYDSLRLLGEVLSTLRLAEDGKVAWMAMSRQLMVLYPVPLEETENFVNSTISIRGVEVGLFFKEVGPEETKVSWRSKIAVDVSRLAAHFGGGGHARAAGCTIKAPLAQAIDQVLLLLREYYAGAGLKNTAEEERERV
ncbi:MAG: bifunctional oligoribonuclease/PAP phosphatase NrnA [Firmicutes bacterium]|nr:bifunctional oligoribonuclease/PAP phosphatase NrnA [Bacillota bacterium]